MSLTICSSNRVERLTDALAELLTSVPDSPFEPELIVMQSKGMQRWLSMELASRFGVWANCSYPFPNALISRLFDMILPGNPGADSGYAPEMMAWRIFGILPGMAEKDGFQQIRGYLEDDPDGLKRFQLAGKIADLFDQYTLYRPEMLRSWEKGGSRNEEDIWQADLWRELAAQIPGTHRGRLKEDFCRALSLSRPGEPPLPKRISVFGISYLPSYHLEILGAVARFTEVHLFLLSPTREYWGDIIRRRKTALPGPEKWAPDEGNPLLASLGRLGRDFSEMVLDMCDLMSGETELYEEPDGSSLLSLIQRDILLLAGDDETRERPAVHEDDCSVRIHSCHSPMREAEVLYDTLLELFENHPDLEPRDVLVMTPDIDLYAPFISAVFEGPRDKTPKIPYSIADRRMTSDGQVAGILLKLLELPDSRRTAVQLMDLLEQPPVRLRFAIAEEELATIRTWLEETGIRWGMDERDRTALGLPGYRANSWRAGLERMLLGYAMAPDDDRMFDSILPYGAMEGSLSETLGKLVDFVNAVENLIEALAAPRPLDLWSLQFRSLLDDFITSNNEESSRELASLSEIIGESAEPFHNSAFTGSVEFTVVREWLKKRLSHEDKGFGFMTGGVTFCAMLPMRSIPFRVIALMGMNDGAFPRQNRPPAFDLIARQPRAGDRSVRDEDRYIFLETLLSARQCLYISYVGQSMRDNAEIPPSVLVSELIDSVNRMFTTEDGTPPGDALVTKQRLQAFSRCYFTADSRLFSYSEENCAALLESRCSTNAARPFMKAPLENPGHEWREVTLTKFLRFFDNPTRFFLENRLGIRLENIRRPLEEREPFSLDHLSSYALKNSIVGKSLKGDDPEELLPAVRNLGILPPGAHGRHLFYDSAENASRFAKGISSWTGSSPNLPPLDFDLESGGFRLSGRLDGIWENGMLRYRCASMKAKDQMRAWIGHLLLNAAGNEGYPRETVLIMTDRSVTFVPVNTPLETLKELLELYWQGLRAPLPFFPESAMACAESSPWNTSRAASKWNDGYNGIPGEGSDPYFRICFGKEDPFGSEFSRVARTILDPLLLHRKKGTA